MGGFAWACDGMKCSFNMTAMQFGFPPQCVGMICQLKSDYSLSKKFRQCDAPESSYPDHIV